jgi:hypothetical protein
LKRIPRELQSNRIRKEMTDDDALLVALIDNELDESSRQALLACLAADEQLRRREVREGLEPFFAAKDRQR